MELLVLSPLLASLYLSARSSSDGHGVIVSLGIILQYKYYSFPEVLFANLISLFNFHLFCELWGPKFQKMIRGIAISDDIQTMIMMWELKADEQNPPTRRCQDQRRGPRPLGPCEPIRILTPKDLFEWKASCLERIYRLPSSCRPLQVSTHLNKHHH